MTTCPICGGDSAPEFEVRDENHRISATDFHYERCKECGTIFLADPPADLGRYYEADYYQIPSLEKLAAVSRKDRNKIHIVNRFSSGKRLLEIGPAFGTFAFQAKEAGYNVDVIEMDERCCAYLRDQVKVSVVQSDRPDEALANQPAHDVIALWHVLEHVRAPAEVVEAAASNLAAGGILVIATPNADAAQFRLMGRHWPHVDAPRHLTLMPAKALGDLAAKHGLEPVFVTTDDSDARHWNAFGWQWLLMNRVRSKLLKRAMWAAGTLIALAMSPLDRRSGRGSAYTIVLKKAA